MTGADDYEIQHEYDTPPEGPRRRSGWWIAAGLLTVVAAAAIYFMFGKRPVPQSAAMGSAPGAVVTEPARPLGGEAEPIAIPPLDASDQVVRTLVRALSNRPAVAAWLATDDLIRNFTAAVANIAEGTSPARQLSSLRPRAAFRVVESGGKSYIDPRSYDRNATVVDAVASVDPAGASRLYATLRTRIEEAAGELGLPPGRFDQVLERAIVVLLRTPTPDAPLQVIASDQGIGYEFVDGRLEGLSTGQKALLRMGPRNARIIKTKLREIALALGIPPVRLPAE